MCGTACAPSTSTGTSARCAISTICWTGLTVPSAFETCAHRDQLRARREQLRKFVQQQLAAIVDRHDAQLRALLFAEHLPRHDVGVVLHGGDQHFIARADMRAAVGLRDQVDGLGGAAHKDDFALVGALRKRCTVRRAASCSSVACSER